MASKPSKSDYKRLEGVHSVLIEWVELCYQEFAKSTRFPRCRLRVIDGVRTIEQQRAHVQSGASRTMNSKHLTGHAVDLIVQSYSGSRRWVPRWEKQVYDRFAKQIGKPCAKKLGLKIVWGGDWDFYDGPHWQISPAKYPL